MNTGTLALDDFLLARLAEAWNSAATPQDLADSAARRRIVERCSMIDYAEPAFHLAQGVMSELALPYALHPDYREEWRP